MTVEMCAKTAADHYRATVTEPALNDLGRRVELATVGHVDLRNSYDKWLRARCDTSDWIEHKPFVARSYDQVAAIVEQLNHQVWIDGILVYYPTGFGRDIEIMNRVAPDKDVEGLNALNQGYLTQFVRELDDKCKPTVPCTAKAVGKLLDYYDIEVDGKVVLIINNSLLVGRPLGIYLENLGATVIRAYDKTPASAVRAAAVEADIIVTAVPSETDLFLDIKEGAVLVNVSGLRNYPPELVQYTSYHADKIGSLTCEMAILQTIYTAKRQGSKS